jgi:hypothetical protein
MSIKLMAVATARFLAVFTIAKVVHANMATLPTDPGLPYTIFNPKLAEAGVNALIYLEQAL